MTCNMSEVEWDAVIGVNTRGTFATTRHAATTWSERAIAAGVPG